MAYAGAPRTPGRDASHSCSFRMGASPRSSSPNTVGFFSMSSARGRFVGPSLKFGGKRQEAICAVARKARQRMRRQRNAQCESPELNVLGAARVGVSLHNCTLRDVSERRPAVLQPAACVTHGCASYRRFGSPLLKLQAESGRCNWTRTSDTTANGRSSKDTGPLQHVPEPSDAVAAPRR